MLQNKQVLVWPLFFAPVGPMASASCWAWYMEFGLYKILFHFEALLHNNIFCKHPLYCAIYCTILPVIAPSRQNLMCFWGVWRCFLFFRDRILDGSRCLKKKSCQTRKRGHYCTLLCDIPLPAPFYCLQYCAIYFPHDPLYCNKILAISCKGQHGVR